MLGRYWITGLAFGLALLVTSLGVQAQESKSTPQRDAQDQQRPPESTPFRFPVEIVEDEAAADARKGREEQAAQREIDDLLAQRGMEAAAVRVADYAYWQTILVGVGTGLLVVTLLLTLQANKAAVRAAEAADATVKVTGDIGRRQLRAYVLPEKAEILNFDSDDKREIRIVVKNFGQTPAYKVDHWTAVQMSHDYDPQKDNVRPDNLGNPVDAALGPSSFFSIFLEFGPLSENQRQMIRDGKTYIWVYGEINYQDAFAQRQWARFRFSYGGKEGSRPSGGMTVAAEGNDAS